MQNCSFDLPFSWDDFLSKHNDKLYLAKSKADFLALSRELYVYVTEYHDEEK